MSDGRQSKVVAANNDEKIMEGNYQNAQVCHHRGPVGDYGSREAKGSDEASMYAVDFPVSRPYRVGSNWLLESAHVRYAPSRTATLLQT
ncbi:unnamed protein product [Peronospora belbahrii]|uniref:Uncharacterized protein n=1 Tax=Peronospora belbahrii TaxID=622444 RepID=A0AAU9L4W0_9STRA|nr:unnamed protein product [Peronospora belbahrii]